jgi:hypothetical protein
MKSDRFRSGKTLAIATASKARLTVAAPPLILATTVAEHYAILLAHRA